MGGVKGGQDRENDKSPCPAPPLTMVIGTVHPVLWVSTTVRMKAFIELEHNIYALESEKKG